MREGGRVSPPVGASTIRKARTVRDVSISSCSISHVTTTGPPAPPVLRGSPHRHYDLAEAFQIGYVRSIAAAAGCVIMGVPEVDEGIDLILSHTSTAHTAVDRARLEIQLKTTNSPITPRMTHISAPMRRDRFVEMSEVDPIVSKIVILMSVPPSQNDWVHATPDRLKLHHAAYWVNLDGAPAPTSARPSARAPLTQLFDDVALCAMMARIGRGGKP